MCKDNDSSKEKREKPPIHKAAPSSARKSTNLNGSLTPRSSLSKTNDIMSRSLIIEKRPSADMAKSFTETRRPPSAKKVRII